MAVVVPVAAVALIVLALLFWWRKRKQRKDAEELRRKEVEDYGFNPNNDPTLPAIGGASSNGDETSEMRETDGAGYRGWGTTSTNRKASTTLSSGNGGIGIARSGSGSDPGGYHGSSPTANTAQNSDVQSGDPLVGSPQHDRPMSGDSETIGALGTGPAANGNRNDIHRGLQTRLLPIQELIAQTPLAKAAYREEHMDSNTTTTTSTPKVCLPTVLMGMEVTEVGRRSLGT